MKLIPSLSRAAAFLAAFSLAGLSFAQPGPGFVPGDPRDPRDPRAPGAPRGPIPGRPGGFDPGPRVPRPPIPVVPVPPRPPEATEADPAAVAAQVQRKLKRLGYYAGTVDGEMGRGTRAAIRAYQSENNMEVTGTIDRPLLRSLGLL